MAVVSTSLLLTTTAVAVATYFIVKVLMFFMNLKRIGRALGQFPQDPKHWLMGHWKGLHRFDERGFTVVREKVARHPRYSAIWRTFLMPLLSVHHPETVQLVLRRSDPKPTTKGFYKYGRCFLGEGLLVSSGAKWFRNRRLLTPAFHFDILRSYVTVYNETCDLMLAKLGKYAASGESMELYFNMTLLTLDVMMRCAMSYQNDIQIKGESHPYVQAVGKVMDIWMRRATQLIGQFEPIWNLTKDAKEFYKSCDFAHSLSESIIRKRKQTLAEKGVQAKSKYMDFLDILLMARDDSGLGLTDLEIRDEVDNFMFAGHDTTASSITYTLYELAKRQDYQDRCRQEVDEILAGRDEDVIQWEDLSKFRYLTLCIKEAQRMHSVVPFIHRELKEPLTLDGKTLPAGTGISVLIYALHHNPQVWEDSMVYDPDRFLPENISKKHPYAFIPFSAGPRNCIGQTFSMHEQKVIIARILRRFRLELDPTSKLEKSLGIISRPKNGLKMKIVSR